MSLVQMKKLDRHQIQVSALKNKLEELLFFENLLESKDFAKKPEKRKIKELLERKKLDKGMAQRLESMVEEKKLNKEKKIKKESIKEFIKAFNSYSKLAKQRGHGIGFIIMGKKPTIKDKILNAFTGSGETPKPVKGGTGSSNKILSLFLETGKKEPGKTKKTPGFLSGLFKVKKSLLKNMKSIKGKSAPKTSKIKEVFKVPVFATGSGLTEKSSSEEFKKTKTSEEGGTIVDLKEQLFAEGKKGAKIPKGNLITLIPGYAFGKIIKKKDGTKVYYVIEPDLSKEEKKKIEKIKEELIKVITIEELSREKMFKRVEKIINKKGYTFTKQGRHKLMYYLSRDLLGLERIEPLMHDPLIEDVECDGVNIPIYIVHQKEGHIPTNIIFKKNDELEDYIIKLAQLSKTYVSYASPLVDSILPDGSRVNAILTKSVSTKGPSFTIRLFPDQPLPPTTLIKNGTVTPRIMAYLWTVLEYKKSILITGPTASGKTTLLNAIAMCLPFGDRVVSIEDTRELNIKHEHWLPQVSRSGFGPPDASGTRFGEVSMMALIRESFRQRPDYLIVGEVRGKETFILFQGMASGHCSLATFHARSVEDVASRLTTPPINLYPGLLESVDIIINLGFAGEQKVKRRIRTIAEIKQYNKKEGRLDYNDLMESNLEEISEQGEKSRDVTEFFPLTSRSYLLKEISKEYNVPLKELQTKIEKRIALLKQLVKEGVLEYTQFNKRLEVFKDAERQSN